MASPLPPPRHWASLCFYAYVFTLLARLFGSALILCGTSKLGGPFFLGVVGVALPNIALAAFFALALGTNSRKPLCVDENIVLANFALLALLLNAVDVTFFMLHAFRHGAARSLHPSERFGDSGTSYTAAILALLGSAALLGWAALDVTAVYCHEGARPHLVTFEGLSAVKCQEEPEETESRKGV